MKNKSLYILLLALLLMSPSYSTENYFNFETQNIEIKEDGNLINAYFGKAIDKDGVDSRNITMKFERVTPVDNTNPNSKTESEWF